MRDSGIGIAPELMPRLFDIFVQGAVALDRSQGGLGIGLSLVRSLVELHGGSIEADSQGAGHGSTFILRLPLLDKGGDAAAVSTPVRDGAVRSAFTTVLLIEDNEDARRMLAAQLSASGFRVIEAGDGMAGIALAEREQPQLAIIDIGLPGMNGYEVAARLRQGAATCSMRLVALTGYGQEADRRRALEAGFDEHFTKPLKSEELAALLVNT